MSVGVIVATYGDKTVWEPLARNAIKSVDRQTIEPYDVSWVHGKTLHEARNFGAENMPTDQLIFLDADDELDERYIECMLAAEGDIRRPNTIGMIDGVLQGVPEMIPRRNLKEGNFIVIGAMCYREQFLRVGGFEDYPILEDWVLWQKLQRDGATIVDVPDAIYKINIRPGSRNTHKTQHNKIYQEIRRRFK